MQKKLMKTQVKSILILNKKIYLKEKIITYYKYKKMSHNMRLVLMNLNKVKKKVEWALMKIVMIMT